MPQPKHADVSVDLQQDEASLFPQAVDLCQALLPQWASLPEKDIKVYRFVKADFHTLMPRSTECLHLAGD